MGNDIIVTSFLKIAQQFFECEYFLLIPIDVRSFKLIEGQIKELQGVVPNTPRAENDQKSPGRIGLNQVSTQAFPLLPAKISPVEIRKTYRTPNPFI